MGLRDQWLPHQTSEGKIEYPRGGVFGLGLYRRLSYEQNMMDRLTAAPAPL